MKKIIIISSLFFFAFGLSVQAQETEVMTGSQGRTITTIGVDVPQDLSVTSQVKGEQEINSELQGIDIKKINEAPSNLSLWWRSIKENVSLWLTFDNEAKAEKLIRYAEERLIIAELMSQSDNEQVRQRYEAMITKANQFMEQLADKAPDWQNESGELANRLRLNIAAHQMNREAVMQRIEANLSDEQLERLDELKQQALTNGNRLINAINNPNLPEDIANQLQVVQTRIEAHLQAVGVYIQQRQQLQEQVKAGDEQAKEQLQNLKQNRNQVMQQIVDDFKQSRLGNSDDLDNNSGQQITNEQQLQIQIQGDSQGNLQLQNSLQNRQNLGSDDDDLIDDGVSNNEDNEAEEASSSQKRQGQN